MKGKINKYILYSLICFTISCRSNNNIYSILTSDNCYWDIRSGNRVTNCYQFNVDSSCTYLSYNAKGVRTKFDFDPNLRTDKTWKLQGDTTLYILGLRRKILSYSQDSILLQNPNTGDEKLLIRNCK